MIGPVNGEGSGGTSDESALLEVDAALAVPSGSTVSSSSVDLYAHDGIDFMIVVSATGAGTLTGLLITPEWSLNGTDWGPQQMSEAISSGVIPTSDAVYDVDVSGKTAVYRFPFYCARQGGRRYCRLLIEGTGDSATVLLQGMRRGRK